MLNSEPKVNLISECFIKPDPKLIHEASKKPYPLSPMDLAMLSLDYMQKGLLYSKPCDEDYQTEVFLQKLKHTLSLSLLHFYPLAGRFFTQNFPDEHACCIFLDVIKGPSARFIHASVDLTVSDILSSWDVHPIMRFFFELGEKVVNYDGHIKALLSIQVTELLDGIFIGISLTHSIGDGTSLAHYIKTLSDIFNSVGSQYNDGEETYDIPNKPIFKPFFGDDEHGPSRSTLKLPFIEPHEFISRYDPGPLRMKIFHFSPASISRLKTKANNECNNNRAHKIELSSFQSLSGLIWKAITRARKLDPEMETNVSVAMNTRPRLKPPVSQNCFGNYVSRGTNTCKVGDLLCKDLGWAALLIHAGITNQDDKTIRESLKAYCEAPTIAQPANESVSVGANFVMIVGSPRFDLFGVEFGFGKPVAIRGGNANKCDGRVAVSQGCEGPGSVELDVCLLPLTMSALEVDEEFMSFVTIG